MGPDTSDAPVKNGLSAQPGNTESLALDRNSNSIFHAKKTCGPTVVQVGVSADVEASGDSTISSYKPSFNEELVKTKCNESKTEFLIDAFDIYT